MCSGAGRGAGAGAGDGGAGRLPRPAGVVPTRRPRRLTRTATIAQLVPLTCLPHTGNHQFVATVQKRRGVLLYCVIPIIHIIDQCEKVGTVG